MPRSRMKFDDKDARLVRLLTKYGASRPAIARELGIDPKSLAKHFADEIETGEVQRRAAYINALWRWALSGSARAQGILLDRMTAADRLAPRPSPPRRR